MYKCLYILIFLWNFDLAYCQKEDYIWLGGYQHNENKRANGFAINFNNDPISIDNTTFPLGIEGNNASICDKDGNLLFYTNGRGVMNRYHQIMPNGDSINAGEWADRFWGGEFNGYPGSQNTLILKDPKTDYGYYVFHKPIIYHPIIEDSSELHFSYVDMNLENGKGDVLQKNIRYYEKQDVMSSYFSAVKHSNRSHWWIIQPIEDDSIYLTFLLNENGIHRMHNQNSHQFFNRDKSNASGRAIFSPDGTKYALYNYTDQLHVYDFDRESGLLSNHQKIVVFQDSSLNFGPFTGIEWSPNSRFIYTASHRYLHQIDMWSSDPASNVILIDTYNGTQDPFGTHINYMAQGPDCRIYVFPKNGTYSLHVINKPDELGKECNFVQNGIKLPYPNGNGSIPNFPRFRVDEVDKCDPSISSIFGESVYYRRDIEIYPSPSYGLYQVRMPDDASDGHLVVTDLHGKVVNITEINDFQHVREIDISTLPAGHYNIEYYPRINPEQIFYGRQVVKI